MDNIQIIIYIIFGVVYLLMQLMKKRGKGEDGTLGDPFDFEPPFREEVKPKPIITDPFKPAKTKAEAVAEEIKHEVEEVKHEVDDMKRKVSQAKTAEDYRALYEQQQDEEARAAELLEQRRREAIEITRGTRQNPDEKARQRALETEKLFKEEQLPKEPVSPYAKLLKNKAAVRQAFILTEILNRKYD
jgi:type IV secretory pathway VirB10-like protein